MNTFLFPALGLPLLALAASGANFANAGFEDPVLPGGTPFVGRWEPFASAGGSRVYSSAAAPRTGAQSLVLEISGSDNSYAGIFQDVRVFPGQEATFSGYHRTPGDPLDVGIEIRIEWRNSKTGSDISRTMNLTDAPSGAAYALFSLTAPVPPGADTARVVYAIQTVTGGDPTNSGSVGLDDFNFLAIPEPRHTVLLALASAAIVLARRRQPPNGPT